MITSQLQKFGKRDRAVSPVIGVILMVAITVILAAVIGTFVLTLGDDLGSSSGPQAQLSFDGDAATGVTISHNGGDSLEGAELSGSALTNEDYEPFDLTAGTSEDVESDDLDSNGGTLTVVVGSSVVGSYEVPAGDSDGDESESTNSISFDGTPTADDGEVVIDVSFFDTNDVFVVIERSDEEIGTEPISENGQATIGTDDLSENDELTAIMYEGDDRDEWLDDDVITVTAA